MSPITMDNKKLLWDWLGLGSGLVGPIGIVPLKYLLRANFNAADQGYADAQVLDTVAEGVQDGQLTVVEVDGTLAISSNECAFTAQSTPAWGDLGFYSQAITRALGRGLLGTVNIGGTVTILDCIVWSSAQTLNFASAANMDAGVQLASDGLVWPAANEVWETGSGLISYSASTDYQLAIILGGYDSSGTPFYAGQTKANYTYGAWFLVKGGAFTNWTLLWTTSSGNTATLYAAMSNYDAAGNLDDFKIPDKDLSAVQVPVAYSSFTAANGTSLDAITPEVGGAWTEQSGDWDIQSNRANSKGAVPASPKWVATVETNKSDVIIDSIVNIVSSDGSIVIRYADNDNLWAAQLRENFNDLRIIERNAGTWIERASTSVVISASVDYDLRAIADGQTIDAFVDGANKITYASASLNETATKHGYRWDKAGTRGDNFTVMPRTSSTYDSVLNGV